MTIKINSSVVINKPVETVFEFMATAENDPLWQSGVLESRKTSPGPIAIGTTEESEAQYLGQRVKSTFLVTEYEPYRKIGYKTTSGPLAVKVGYTFDALGGEDTKVTFVAEGELSSIFKLAEPVLGRMAQRQWENDLASLKDILEAQPIGIAK